MKADIYYFQGDDTICFAEFCDIMRCDIIMGAKKAEFWDVSLCLEDDMKDLSQNCQVGSIYSSTGHSLLSFWHGI